MRPIVILLTNLHWLHESSNNGCLYIVTAFVLWRLLWLEGDNGPLKWTWASQNSTNPNPKVTQIQPQFLGKTNHVQHYWLSRGSVHHHYRWDIGLELFQLIILAILVFINRSIQRYGQSREQFKVRWGQDQVKSWLHQSPVKIRSHLRPGQRSSLFGVYRDASQNRSTLFQFRKQSFADS